MFRARALMEVRLHEGRAMPNTPDGEESLEGRYTNYFQIGFNAYEFVLDFGLLYPPDAGRFHTRIVTNSGVARDLSESLERSLRDHEREYEPRRDERRDEE
jgi:hypothetical protein